MATMATSQGASVHAISCADNFDVARSTKTSIWTGLNLIYEDDSGIHKSGKFETLQTSQANFGDQLYSSPPPMSGHSTSRSRSSSRRHEDDQKWTDEQLSIKLQQLKEANQRTMEEYANLLRGTERGDSAAIGIPVEDEGSESQRTNRPNIISDATGRYTGDKAADAIKDLPENSGRIRDKEEVDITASQSWGVRSQSGQSSRNQIISSLNQKPELRRTRSLDDKDWYEAVQVASGIDNNNIHCNVSESALKTAFSQIRGMWQSFKIDDYAPVQQLQGQKTKVSLQKKRKERHNTSHDRIHKTTVPKPFQMSVREENREKKKTRAQIELDEQNFQKQREEEMECQMRFKAQPAPAHIYKPLYNELQIKTETRRRYLKQHSQDILKSQEKPFRFMKREESKKQQMQSATVTKKSHDKDYIFIARPVPAFVVSNGPKEMFLEEEKLRHMRLHKRAKKMLKKASLPPNMTVYKKIKEQREKEKTRSPKYKQCKQRTQKLVQTVPDHEHLYHNLQKELAHGKHGKKGTVLQPFSVETHDYNIKEMEEASHVLRDADLGIPRVELGILPTCWDSLAFQSTTDLHSSYERSMNERQQRRKEQQEQEGLREQLREGKLRKYILQCRTGSPERSYPKGLTRQHRETDHAPLENVEELVEKHLPLFEQRKQLQI